MNLPSTQPWMRCDYTKTQGLISKCPSEPIF
ncbi:rCG35139 [Rattus norvegicus]|uniref:RCG35139 n=1 Tax=Rattus norvegicus TaxID=10116 RepID=A6HH92_RAT|nr:rCG35139 [Rattus norvegicus]